MKALPHDKPRIVKTYRLQQHAIDSTIEIAKIQKRSPTEVVEDAIDAYKSQVKKSYSKNKK